MSCLVELAGIWFTVTGHWSGSAGLNSGAQSMGAHLEEGSHAKTLVLMSGRRWLLAIQFWRVGVFLYATFVFAEAGLIISFLIIASFFSTTY